MNETFLKVTFKLSTFQDPESSYADLVRWSRIIADNLNAHTGYMVNEVEVKTQKLRKKNDKQNTDKL